MVNKTPWTFHTDRGCYNIKDANGNMVMCNEQCYSFINMTLEEWKMVVNAVNYYADEKVENSV